MLSAPFKQLILVRFVSFSGHDTHKDHTAFLPRAETHFLVLRPGDLGEMKMKMYYKIYRYRVVRQLFKSLFASTI
jgi:hypothetical protein